MSALLRPARAAGVAVEELDGEGVAYDLKTHAVHHLNPSALAIFNACDGVRTVDEIASAVAPAFGVQPAAIRDDVARTLEELIDLCLLFDPAAAPRANP